ncbi:MAG TPA: long-chain-fatty-acid--CoA ligase [Chloroflexota bacterium]|nr:long-chain-fatty-acid--CoA ligase [Chloroflexota bacterium]
MSLTQHSALSSLRGAQAGSSADEPQDAQHSSLVGDHLLAAARDDGQRTAVVCGGVALSYAAFAERAARLAGALRAVGVAPGDRVAYVGPNCHALLEAYYGVPWAGAVLVPLHVRLARPELAALLADAAPRAVLVDATCLARLRPDALEQVPLRVLVGVDTAPAGWQAYETWLARAVPVEPLAAAPDGVAEMFYTSGSTGQPRAAMLSGRNLAANAAGVREMLALGPDDVVLHALSLFHANGWGFPHAAVMARARQVVLRKFVPRAALELLARERATVTYVVPTMARALAESRGPTRRELASLRCLVVGGAASTPELVQAAEARLGGTFVGSYGLTETSPVLTLATLRPEMADWPPEARWRQQAAAGRPTPAACLRVVDEAGMAVPADGMSVGEVQVAGDLVMAGYWQRPAETAAACPDGWLRTGDLATVDPWGYLRIVARLKDLIVCGGEKIAPPEVERVLAAHPAVRDAAVVGAPHPRWGQAPEALVVLRPGAEASASALRHHCARHLAAFKVPRAIHFVSRLPRTATGKLARARLAPASSHEREPSAPCADAPCRRVQRRLSEAPPAPA